MLCHVTREPDRARVQSFHEGLQKTQCICNTCTRMCSKGESCSDKKFEWVHKCLDRYILATTVGQRFQVMHGDLRDYKPGLDIMKIPRMISHWKSSKNSPIGSSPDGAKSVLSTSKLKGVHPKLPKSPPEACSLSSDWARRGSLIHA